MDFSIILTEGSLIFQIILIMVYFHKQQFNDARSKIYKYLIIVSLIYGITQIGVVLTLKYLDSLEWVSYILWKFQWILAIVWWGFVYYYTYVICNTLNVDKVKDVVKHDTFRKVIFISLCVIGIVSIFIPNTTKFNYESYENFTYMPQYMKYIVSVFAAIITVLISVEFIKNRKKLNSNEKNSIIFLFIATILCVVLQVIFDDISFIGLAFVVATFIFYSLIENPDIKLMQEISTSQGDIEKSSQTKTDFLSNMTYEIKTPMNLIKSLCDELMSMPNYDEKLVREDIGQIVASGNSLIEIINNVLDISKIESGKTIIQEKDYKIKDLLTDVVNIAKSKIGTKQVKLMVNIDQNISSVLNGDYAKLYQALVNILTNATKYTDVGRVTFTLTSTKSSGVEHLLFKVTDTGSGIKEEDQDKIFTKGNRLDNATESEVEGSGLGLVITKQYIDSLGGKIWFDSQYRVGTTFYIDIPQKIVDATPLGNTVNEQAKEETKQLIDCSKYTVLIVDDNLLNIKVAKRLLEKYKFNIESVTAGKDCVYKVKEGTHYDAIFMDHMMPEMDGIETLHVLKKLDGYVLPPIIALTANAVAGMKEMYINEGFDEYLSKPINTTELDRVVNLFFGKK